MKLKSDLIELDHLTLEDIDYIHEFTKEYSNIAEFSTSRIRSKVHWIDKFNKTGLWDDNYGMLKIIDNEDNQTCGLVWFFRPPSQHSQLDFFEVAFNIFKKSKRKKGLATEALKIVSAYLFDAYNVERIQSTTMLNLDDSSITKVMKSTGFTFEGTLRKAIFIQGKQIDLHIFSLLREESKKLRELVES